jgi:hypothetical protein
MAVSVERLSDADAVHLRKWGYTITATPVATAIGVSVDPQTGASSGAIR